MLRMLVRQHGQFICQAEAAEVQALWEHPHLLELESQWVAHRTPRLRASWSEELNTAVGKALAAGEKRLPEEVTQADWERELNRYLQEEHLSAQPVSARAFPAVQEYG
jgi:hypothetical protein